MAYNNIDINLKASLESKEKESLRQPSKSLKSIRTYQLGVVYKDKHGRETPVFTSQDATFTVPKRLCEKQNSIVANIFNEAPDWADSYKFFVKETSNEYYNICMDRFYESADGNVWLSFPSAERNKIKEDDYIILKKQPGKDAKAVLDEARYRIIDVQNEAPEFIKVDYEVLGIDTIRLLADGAMPGTKTIKMDGDHTSNDFEDSIFFDTQQVGGANKSGNNVGFITGTDFSDIAVRIQSATEKTNFIDVATIVKVSSDYHVKLSNVLPGEKLEGLPVTTAGVNSIVKPNSGFTGQTANQDITFAFAKKVLKNKSEFEGRFFVKIKRDEALNANIIQTSLSSITPTVIRSMPIGHAKPLNSDNKTGFDSNSEQENYFQSMSGGQFFIDEINRSRKFTRSSDRREKDNGFGIKGDGPGGRINTNNPRTDQAAWLQCSMELSLSKVANSKENGFGMAQQNTNDREFYEAMRTPGTYFRFKEDPYQIVYMVRPDTRDSNDGSHGDGLFNYSRKDDLDRPRNKTNRIYLHCVAVGWRLENDQGYYHHSGEAIKYIFDEDIEGKYPWNYKNKDTSGAVAVSGFEPPTEIETADNGATSALIDPGPWDPTKRGYGTYGTASSNNLHTASATSYGSITQTGSAVYNTDQSVHYGLESGRFHNHIEVLELTPPDDGKIEFDPNPAIWETEPKEAIDLDIYYEASQAYPTKLTNKTNELLIPYGSKVECVDVVEVTHSTANDKGSKRLYLPENTYVEDWAPTGHGGDTILLNIEPSQLGYVDLNKTIEDTVTIGNDTFDNQTNEFLITPNSSDNPKLPFHNVNVFSYINNYFTDQVKTGVNITRGKPIKLKFTRPDNSHITLPVQYFSIWRSNDNFQNGFNPTIPASQNTGYHVLIKLKNDLSKNIEIKLPYFNCYSFGNGVESDRIRDDFNAVRLDKGVKASSVIAEPYIEEQRINGLIYSGIYNSNSSKNDLNQFIAGESITKDINPTYGSIQKLYQKDPFLITFCEDKVLKITAGKDTLFNAGGNTQLVSSNRVLGDSSAYQGEYGISKNPESFAFESFRTYFTDKQRGKVLRLSGDGITEISNAGMRYYFERNLKTEANLIGTFDDRKQEYNLTIEQIQDSNKSVTVSFSEFAKGWVSFKSFIPEHGLSMNNDYYTFKRGNIYLHHSNTIRNNFYNLQFDSYVDVIFNQSSESVKNFRSMKYEGSQSRITEVLSDNKYFNNEAKKGWYVEFGNTDLETIGQMEFKNKEGKWFSSIKGTQVFNPVNLNSKEFSFQGIDIADDVEVISPLPPPGKTILGCTDPDATNYNPNATQNDGSCTYAPTVSGCTNPLASNYDPQANVDDGSCILKPVVYGCMEVTALNYDPNATVDDGSCVRPIVLGCTDDGTDPNFPNRPSHYKTGRSADNYDPQATADDGSCIYSPPPKTVEGCTDPDAANYVPGATNDDGSCFYLNSDGCDVNYKPIFLTHTGKNASATYPSDKADQLYERFEINIADKPSNYLSNTTTFDMTKPSGPGTNANPPKATMWELHWKVKIPGFNVNKDAYSWELRESGDASTAQKWTDKTLFLGDYYQNQVGPGKKYTTMSSFLNTLENAGWGFVVLTDGGYQNNGDKFSWLAHPMPDFNSSYKDTVEVEFTGPLLGFNISNINTQNYKVPFPYSYDFETFPTTGTKSVVLHSKYPQTFSNQHNCAIMYQTVNVDPFTPPANNASAKSLNPNAFGYTNRAYANLASISTYDNSQNFLPYSSAKFRDGRYILKITHYKNFLETNQTTCDYTQSFKIGYSNKQLSDAGHKYPNDRPFAQGGFYNVLDGDYTKATRELDDILDFYNSPQEPQVTPKRGGVPVTNTNTTTASPIGPRPNPITIINDDDASQDEPIQTNITRVDNNTNNTDLNIDTDATY
jgi:hypothetical protein